MTTVEAEHGSSLDSGELQSMRTDAGTTEVRSGHTAGWAVALIRGYQLARSGRPTGCRFLPTCSEYAIEAISSYGVVRGSLLAARRILRCNPWGRHGVDPIPSRRASCKDH